MPGLGSTSPHPHRDQAFVLVFWTVDSEGSSHPPNLLIHYLRLRAPSLRSSEALILVSVIELLLLSMLQLSLSCPEPMSHGCDGVVFVQQEINHSVGAAHSVDL